MDSLTATTIERDVVIVSGADAGEYLQTQITQDVLSLDKSESAWSFVLTPKSEIEFMLRVTNGGSERFILDVDPSRGSALRARLDGLLFRMDVLFEEAVWTGIAWRGPGAFEVLSDAPIAARLPWFDTEAMDVVGPVVPMPAAAASLDSGGLDALRIAAGWPEMGAEIVQGTTPAMTGLVGETVSFDKGCYTGQEFVARVHHRGARPPKRLVRLKLSTLDRLQPGSTVTVEGRDAGTVTSAADGVALGYLTRAFDTPASGRVEGLPVEILAFRAS